MHAAAAEVLDPGSRRRRRRRPARTMEVTRAVFFDVDFTLIHPGQAFLGPGYRDFCATARRHGRSGSVRRRRGRGRADARPARATPTTRRSSSTTPRRSSPAWAARGEHVERAARDIYDEWSACHHFSLYEDVPEVLRQLRARGLTIGLISNTQRCLASFQSHFALDGMFAVRVSSAAHGYMKPHPSIFQTALEQAGVAAGESMMVGDSLHARRPRRPAPGHARGAALTRRRARRLSRRMCR